MARSAVQGVKALIFDFDGVILDSVDVKTRAFARLFERYGAEVVEKVVRYHLDNGGASRHEKFRHYYREFLKKELTTEMLEGLCRDFSSLVADGVARAPYIPGVMEFVNENYESRLCCIVSATPEPELREIIERRGIGRFFSFALGSPAKKDENLRGALDRLGVHARDALFFGDSINDHDAAKAVGVPFVGVVTGHESSLKDADCLLKITDFMSLTMEKTL